MGNPADDVPMIRLSYNDVHKAIKAEAINIKDQFSPDLFIAIGGGGFIPARILRTFCKTTSEGTKKNIPIQAVGLVLYESMGGIAEKAGAEVVRTQWLDFSTLGSKYEKQGGLLGRKILVVDEVDDTRRTLIYCIKELQRDIELQLQAVADQAERERLRKETQLGIFVVHNKLKEKAGDLPADVRYFSAVDTPDVWLAYPWECDGDIEEHDQDRAKNPSV